MNYFPPTELLGACIKAGTKIELPNSLGACAGGGGSELAVILSIGIGGLILVAFIVSMICYACFRLIPRYSVRGNEWARKEAMQAGMRTIALLLVFVCVGIFLTAKKINVESR